MNLSSGTGQKEDNALKRFMGGALAGATATTLTYPFDLLRARMAGSRLYRYLLPHLRVSLFIPASQRIGAQLLCTKATLTGG